MWGSKKQTVEMPIELMSYDEILALKIRVDQELAGRGDAELHALKEKLILIANAQGISLIDLFGGRPGRKEKKKRVVRAKYRDPETGDEWSGRGKAPLWMQSKLEAGAAKEDFLNQ
jgi:DNA-binding protein H-NS